MVRSRTVIKVACVWILAGLVPSVATATVLVVNSPIDVHDAFTSDGICETAPGNGICTLRAAVETARWVQSPVEIHLGPTTYNLSLGELIVHYADVTIRGADRRLTIVQRDPAVPESRFIHHSSGNLTLEDLTIQGFRSSSFGGSVATFDSVLTVRRSFLLDNRAQGMGGFLWSNGSTTVVESCVFAWNAASHGGDLATGGNHDETVIRSSVFEGGWAVEYGGSLYATPSSRTIRIEGSFYADNSAASGGAIALLGDQARIVNSTVNGNRAWNWGGGIFLGGSAILDVVNSTISGNLANAAYDANGVGGGIFSDSGADVDLFNSILSGNREARFVGGCGCWLTFDQECVGEVWSNGYNIVRANNGSCSVAGAASPADPLLAPPAYHGGFNRTQAISPGSPAIDGGDPAGCFDDLGVPVTTDQRHAPRPSGATCDLGAFEFGSLVFDDDFELGVPRFLAGP